MGSLWHVLLLQLTANYQQLMREGCLSVVQRGNAFSAAEGCPRAKAEHFFYCPVYLVLSAPSRKYSALKIHCGFFDFLNRFIIISKLNTLSFCPSNCQALSFPGSAALGRFALGSSEAGNEGDEINQSRFWVRARTVRHPQHCLGYF